MAAEYALLRNADVSPRGNHELTPHARASDTDKQTAARKTIDDDFWFDAKRFPSFEELAAPEGGEGRQQCKDVGIYVNVLEIQEVDQIKETFTAIFVFTFSYIDPTLKDYSPEVTYIDLHDAKNSVKKVRAQIKGIEKGIGRICMVDEDGHELRIFRRDLLAIGDVNWDEHMKLDWSFMNAVEQPEKMMDNRRIEYFSHQGAHVQHKIKFRGIFSDDFHLERMPYDRQILRVQVVGEVPVYMMRFLPTQTGAGKLLWHQSREDRRVPADWCVDKEKLPQLEVLVEEGPTSRARFDVHIYVERHPDYYVNNVIFFVGMFTLCTAFAFSSAVTTKKKDTDPTSEHKQLEILLTLLLTTVAHKIVLASWLPVKPYQTSLDYYIMFCFMFQVGVMAYCVWAEPIEDQLAEWASNAGTAGWRWAESLFQIYERWGSYSVYGPLLLLHLFVFAVLKFHDSNKNPVGRWFYDRLFIEDWHSVYRRKQVWPKKDPPCSIYQEGLEEKMVESAVESDSETQSET
ncbi:unnamed protein product [Symbiodinium sp. CCMP2456]|nr:unnamed protein product [Symbiodinium sp. CCMP2456]